MVRQFHDGMVARVQNDGEFSDPFPVTNGVKLGTIDTRTGNYSAKYLFYRYDDVVAMILPVTRYLGIPKSNIYRNLPESNINYRNPTILSSLP